MQANSWHHKLFQFHTSFWIWKVWKGREKITDIWISREQKELFRWNEKHFSQFLVKKTKKTADVSFNDFANTYEGVFFTGQYCRSTTYNMRGDFLWILRNFRIAIESKTWTLTLFLLFLSSLLPHTLTKMKCQHWW